MRSEIRALEYAAAALVCKLDILLTLCGMSILDVGKGLHISTPDHLDGRDEVFVTIHPVEWPKTSHIQARFLLTGGPNLWSLYEGGYIDAGHLSSPWRHLRFKPSSFGIGLHFDTSPFDHYQRYVVAEGYTQLIEAIKKDAAHQQ